jgi:hypothetical protein
MADDYQAQASIDNELTEPKSGEVTGQANAPTQDEAPTINTGRKITAGLKQTPLRSDARPSATVALSRRGSRQHGRGNRPKWR